MSIELNPVGVGCNLHCTYCYENPMRDAGNINVPFDWDKVRAALDREGYFSLHGGEPLLTPLPTLEKILDYSFRKHGRSGVQTNGTLITDAHIELFKKYKTYVGISFDGPGRLSLSRWIESKERTLEEAKKTEEIIYRLLSEKMDMSLIVTLWAGNCRTPYFTALTNWFRRLDRLGLKWVNLHFMEVDSREANKLRIGHELLTRRMLYLIKMQSEFQNLKFENFRQYVTLLRGRNEQTHCIWNACDPLTTPAVQGINGQGIKTNCNRMNKEGVDWTKAETSGRERQYMLYHTPQEYGGCKDCRFFLMCKGECPGTGIDRDWRNRTEHCETIKNLFTYFENHLVEIGEVPLSLHPDRKRKELEYLSGSRVSNGSHGDKAHGDKAHGDHTDNGAANGNA